MPTCIGKTVSGHPCKCRVKTEGTYCHVHRNRGVAVIPSINEHKVSTCRGFTASGNPCSRKLKHGDYCHSHKPPEASVVAHKHLMDAPSGSAMQISTCEFVGCSNTINEGFACQDHISIYNKMEKPEDCPICMESMKDVRVPLSCGHWVHRGCQIQFKDTCCVCRQTIVLTQAEQRSINQIAARRRAEIERENFEALVQAQQREERAVLIPVDIDHENYIRNLFIRFARQHNLYM